MGMTRAKQMRQFEYDIEEGKELARPACGRRITHSERRQRQQERLKRLFGCKELTSQGIRNGLPTEVIHNILGFVPSISKLWKEQRLSFVRRIQRQSIRNRTSRVRSKYPNSRTPWSFTSRTSAHQQWLEHTKLLKAIKTERHLIQKSIKEIQLAGILRRLENRKLKDAKRSRPIYRMARRESRSYTLQRKKAAAFKAKNLLFP